MAATGEESLLEVEDCVEARTEGKTVPVTFPHIINAAIRRLVIESNIDSGITIFFEDSFSMPIF
jgi:hypothetical protein